jgi:16S rRNA (cytosine967-C5)-methyltransferase
MSEDETTGRRRQGRGRPRTGPAGGDPGRGAQPTQARLLAVRVLDRVQRARAYADLSLHHHLAHSKLSAADRALTTEIVYGTLRWRGRIDFLLEKLLERPMQQLEPVVASALRVGAYQLLFTDRIPASAAVDEAVRCVRALGVERATGLVNAVLRRLAREHESMPLPDLAQDPLGHLVHALSLPEWIARRWLEEFGPDGAAALAEASNAAPPFTVRANRLKNSREELLEELLPRFPDAELCPHARDGLRLGRKGDPQRDAAFLAGRFSVQDEAAQLVLGVLDPQPGDLVLDTCAAPGVKTTGIAERLAGDGGVLALDRNPQRLRLVARTARRLDLRGVHTLERDATRPLTDLPSAWLDSTSGVREPVSDTLLFDRVLADVPCSGLGTLRRNPDARWRVAEAVPRELGRIQLQILQQAAAVLRPGGSLVYSTCTLTQEENEDVVRAFLDDHGLRDQPQSSFRLAARHELPDEVQGVVSDEGFLHCFPHVHDMDGFFAARLIRER